MRTAKRDKGRFALSVCACVLVWTIPPSVAASAPLGCDATDYVIEELPLIPTAINDSGDVAGTTSEHLAAVWSKRHGLIPIPLPPGYLHSEASAINASAVVTGTVYDGDYREHRAFVFSAGKTRLIDGDQGRAFHINDRNQLVGESMPVGRSVMQPTVWNGDDPTSLQNCCSGTATSNNNQGLIVGLSYDQAGRYSATLWEGARPLRIIGPTEQFSSAIGINSRGHVPIETPRSVYLYRNHQLEEISLSKQFPNQARGLNDCDVLVGSFGPFTDALRAFRWDAKHGFEDLNNRLPSNSGWTLKYASAINNRGEIVGRAEKEREDATGYLLIPKRR
jgi:uncharacterized membrane protein